MRIRIPIHLEHAADDDFIQYRAPFVAGKFFAPKSTLSEWTTEEAMAWHARRNQQQKQEKMKLKTK
jgi:hypothetical protein